MIVAEAGDSAMGLRDRLHNGQPHAPSGARGRSEAYERMGQIAVGEARTMITNPDRNGGVGAFADQLYVPRTVRQRIVH